MAEPEKAPLRSAYLDNAKFLLIACVAIGHAIGPVLHRGGWLRTLYVFIHTFHIPVFVFIAGYFSRPVNSPEYLKKNLNHLIAPLLTFHVLYNLILTRPLGKSFDWAYFFVEPYFGLWFLLSLFYWRMLLLWIATVRHLVFRAVATGVMAGYIPAMERAFSLARTFTLLPFFTAGYALRNIPIEERLTAPVARVAGAITLAWGLYLTAAWPSADEQWLYGCYPYAALGVAGMQAAFAKVFVYGINAAMGAAFLTVVPKRRTFFSEWGSRSLYIYVLHIPLVKLAKALGFYKSMDGLGGEIMIPLGALLAVALLSTRAVRDRTKSLIEPRWF